MLVFAYSGNSAVASAVSERIQVRNFISLTTTLARAHLVGRFSYYCSVRFSLDVTFPFIGDNSCSCLLSRIMETGCSSGWFPLVFQSIFHYSSGFWRQVTAHSWVSQALDSMFHDPIGFSGDKKILLMVFASTGIPIDVSLFE